MMDLYKALRKSLEDSPIVWKGEYAYFVNPISDGVPRIDPDLMNFIAESIENMVDWENIDVILGIEAMGLPISTLLSSRMRKPLLVVRKRSYGLEGEICVNQSTGYSKGELYINDLKKGERVLLVDDVLSTGGTMESIIEGVHSCNAIIEKIIIIFEKGDGLNKLKEKTNLNIQSLIRVDMDGGKIVFPG
jgi:adenine phosphoribosyltransferase|tara:strand:- start:1539 stop:2108 length:570 start_codon:yes stop_codon:yes gene_type:complete